MTYEEYRQQQIADHQALIDLILRSDLYHKGENRLGIEVKYDKKFRETGNLYIETHEKARPRAGDYARSGVLRDDNTWLWFQGDLQGGIFFLKKTLRAEMDDPRWRHVQFGTSKGFLLPISTIKGASQEDVDYILSLALHTVRFADSSVTAEP